MQLNPWFVLSLIAIANTVAFCAQGLDKWRAKRDARRIRERTLLLLGLPLAAPGMWTGMRFFRHKTSKPIFLTLAVLVTLANFALIALAWWAHENGLVTIGITRPS